jgi:CDP-glucose 4,6-dehydratase
VLVTGGGGFIGRRLVALLVAQGCHVVVLARSPVAHDLEYVTWISGSVADAPTLASVLERRSVDAVFHLAAQAEVGRAWPHPSETFEANVRGTWVLLDACRQYAPNAAVVVASSEAVYGDTDVAACDESQPATARHPYAASKVCAEVIAQSFASSYKMPVGIARLSNVFGPGDLNLSRIVPGTIVSVIKGERPVIRSDGSPMRDYLYVDDLCAGLMAIAAYVSEVPGCVFNLASGEPVSVLSLTREIISAAGNKHLEPIILSEPTGKPSLRRLSNQAAGGKLGWAPKSTRQERLAETVQWYRGHLAEQELSKAVED